MKKVAAKYIKANDGMLNTIRKMENISGYYLDENDYAIKKLSSLKIRKLFERRLYKTDEYDKVVIRGDVYAKSSNEDKLMCYTETYVIELPERKDGE